ncbi:hypothetical protein [Nannocystis pusilla]|uniref:hypothetical protein n=1 Tax=Nannocystis pusilla TaxID=889268 RepID=UPI003B7F222A
MRNSHGRIATLISEGHCPSIASRAWAGDDIASGSRAASRHAVTWSPLHTSSSGTFCGSFSSVGAGSSEGGAGSSLVPEVDSGPGSSPVVV